MRNRSPTGDIQPVDRTLRQPGLACGRRADACARRSGSVRRKAASFRPPLSARSARRFRSCWPSPAAGCRPKSAPYSAARFASSPTGRVARLRLPDRRPAARGPAIPVRNRWRRSACRWLPARRCPGTGRRAAGASPRNRALQVAPGNPPRRVARASDACHGFVSPSRGVGCDYVRPPLSAPGRSVSASSGSWVMMISVAPVSARRANSSSIISGRSRRRDCRSVRQRRSDSGPGAMARAMATRCCSPPESCVG